MLVDYSAHAIDELRSEFFSRRAQTGPIRVRVRDEFLKRISASVMFGENADRAIQEYAGQVEEAIARMCSAHSVAYLLHACRHIPLGKTPHPMATGLIRATLESACLKYGKFDLCDGIAWSNEILPERILNGRFVRRASIDEIDSVHRSRRLVLTNFDIAQLEEIWLLEQLAEDLHLCSLILRMIPYGGGVSFGDGWLNLRVSDDLKRLGELNDRRLGRFEASATAAVVDHSQVDGSFMLAGYNVLEIAHYAEDIAETFSGARVRLSGETSFVWFTFPLRSFYETHRGFERAFEARNGCSLLALLFVIGGLSMHAVSRWRSLPQFWFHWNMGMDEGISRQQVLEKARMFSGQVARDLHVDPVATETLEPAFDYMTLTEAKRASIEPLLAGPTFPIVPVGQTFLIDYAWHLRWLETLFFDVHVDDQNFKGDALESLVTQQLGNVLPQGACRALDGSSKQIDASILADSLLVIVECKALGRSLGYTRGSRKAIAFRQRKIDEALAEVTDKANWLAARPVGKNYRLDENIKSICSIVVTPFVEFIPSTDTKYWIRDEVARVLTPAETVELARNGGFKDVSLNLVTIKGDSASPTL